MLALASLFAAVIPMIAFVWIVWVLDKYDREPLGLLAANFFWGAFGAIALGIFFSIATSAAFGSTDYYDTILVAPVIEELAKGVFLFWTVRRRQFDNVTDGMVYGMAIGLGFGMTENFLYFLGASTAGEWLLLVIVRTLFSAVMHAMATGTTGAFIGMTKFDFKRWKTPLRIAGFLVAMSLHFLWNFSVSMESLSVAGLGMFGILASVVVIMAQMQISLRHERRLIIRELTEESVTGLLPQDHLPMLCRIRARRKPVWVEHDIDKQRYVALATQLAFRKAQFRLCDPEQAQSYAEEIEDIRAEIRDMLHENGVSDVVGIAPAAIQPEA